MQYRLSFLFDIFATAFLSGVGFFSLALILQRFNGIAGWTLGEVAFLYGMVETSFGLMDMLFSGYDPPIFGNHIRTGDFDQMLLRPISVPVQVLGSEFVLRRLGRIIQGGTVLLLALSIIDIDWTFVKLLYLPIIILSQVAFFAGLFIIGSTLTFWTIESIEAINIFTYGGTEMMSYPMSIYPDWMLRFFTFVLPAIFLNYYPALFILDKPDPFNLPSFAYFLAPLAGLSIFSLALVFWRLGILHYQSTGT
jgi:ABC-2 type transport system permease protein